jgi:hypothetical protein
MTILRGRALRDSGDKPRIGSVLILDRYGVWGFKYREGLLINKMDVVPESLSLGYRGSWWEAGFLWATADTNRPASAYRPKLLHSQPVLILSTPERVKIEGSLEWVLAVLTAAGDARWCLLPIMAVEYDKCRNVLRIDIGDDDVEFASC